MAEEFKSRKGFIKEWTVGQYPPIKSYTRCADCGQYTCVCQDDEPDIDCHCGHPECGAC